MDERELSREDRFNIGCANNPEVEYEIYNAMLNILNRYIGSGVREPNYVNLIALSCGWLPLVKNEKMTVNYGGCTYEITRTE